jgi:ParB-like chromosome segregation protein Spo0J
VASQESTDTPGIPDDRASASAREVGAPAGAPVPAAGMDAMDDERTMPVRWRADGPQQVLVSALVPADSPRVDGENLAHAGMLAQVYAALPPIVVHRDTMRVVDGMHRVHAAQMLGSETVDAVFFDGTQADAFILAVQLNRAHGLPLSAADRKVAGLRIMASHPEWSDRRIAAVTGLAPSTIGALRAREGDRLAEPEARVGRDGKSRPRHSAAGRSRAEVLIAADPTAPLRQVARAAGISPATAADVRSRLAPGGSLSGRRQRNPTGQLPTDSMDTLRQDPSLRFTEAGRLLLRLLELCAMDERRWAGLCGSVPPHQRGAVIRLAQQCAARWSGFAEYLAAQSA